MPEAAKPTKSAVVTARAAGLTALPAGLMGFSKLLDPDDYEGKKSFKLNIHYTPIAISQLVPILQGGMDALADEIAEMAATQGANMKPATPQSPEAWLEDQLHAVTDPAKPIQLPYLKLKGHADRRGYANKGEPDRVPLEVKCWPAQGAKLLDLAKLRVGAGSTVVPMVHINLYRSKTGLNVPQLSLNLVGFRLLQLKAFQGGGLAPEETDDEAIRQALGADVDLSEDYSEYAQTAKATRPPAAGETPEDLAEGMF